MTTESWKKEARGLWRRFPKKPWVGICLGLLAISLAREDGVGGKDASGGAESTGAVSPSYIFCTHFSAPVFYRVTDGQITVFRFSFFSRSLQEGEGGKGGVETAFFQPRLGFGTLDPEDPLERFPPGPTISTISFRAWSGISTLPAGGRW